MKKPRRRSPNFQLMYQNKAEFQRLHREKTHLSVAPARARLSLDQIVRSARSEPDFQTRLVSSVLGRIENLLITIPFEHGEDDVYIKTYDARHFQALMRGLGPNRTYTVVCHRDLQAEIESWGGTHQPTLHFVHSPYFHYTIWAQDAYIALAGPRDEALLCEGVLFRRGEDMTIADDVAAQTAIQTLPWQ